MDIAFWSSFRQKSGVTACVAAMGVLWSALFDEEIAFTSNHISSAGLYERLHGNGLQRERLAGKEYCVPYGEPEYFRRLGRDCMPSEVLQNCGMRYIPMKENAGTELFCSDGLAGVKKHMEEEKHLMIDTACGYSGSSQKIMQEATLTVIALPAERELLDVFFQADVALLQGVYFIIGNYRKNSTGTPEYLNQTYKVSKERIGIIPHNDAFEQAMWEGTTISYLTGNLNCSRQSASYPFIREVRKTAKALRKYAIKRRGGQ